MPRYRYRAYDVSGSVTTGELSVDSRQAALQALARRSEVPILLEEAGAIQHLPWWRREIGGSRRLGMRPLSEFMHELSGLVGASLPVDEALHIISVQPALSSALRGHVAALLARVTEGASLSAAMASRDGAFPPFVVRLVGAGEVSGTLGPVLADLSRSLEQASERASKIAGQLLYPAVLVLAAIIAVGVITTVLVPAVKPLFEDAGATPPMIIEVLSRASEAFSAHGALIGVGVGAALAGLYFFWRTPGGRSAIDAALLGMPLVGSLLQQIETARLARTLSLLVGNGVPLTEALRISSGVLSNRSLCNAVSGILRGVEQGRPLSVELSRSGAFPELLARLARVGEETGQLEGMLLKAGEAYERAVENRLARFVTLLTPILTVFIGVFVGFLVISVMNAILSANALVVP